MAMDRKKLKKKEATESKAASIIQKWFRRIKQKRDKISNQNESELKMNTSATTIQKSMKRYLALTRLSKGLLELKLNGLNNQTKDME